LTKVSIITPSFNQGKFLEETIQSVISQKSCEIQYVIIDGGSKDSSVDIIKRWDNILDYWESEPDKGQSHAINKGFQKVDGEIVNWINSDDYYEPDALKHVVRIFSNSNFNVVIGKSRLFDSQGKSVFSRGTDVYQDNLFKTIGWARIDQPETFFHCKVLSKVGNLNEQLHYVMDRELWMRYLYRYGLNGIARTDQVLVNFRLHETSKTISQRNSFDKENSSLFYSLAVNSGNHYVQDIIEQIEQPNKKLETEILYWDNKELVEKSLNYHLLKRADEHYFQQNYQAAKKYLKGVNVNWLAKEDKNLFNALRTKLRLLPFVKAYYGLTKIQ
jgi:glycosyltransferase involved in cell wall biosynthesis